MNSVWPVAGPARVLAKFRLLVGAREAAALCPLVPAGVRYAGHGAGSLAVGRPDR
jgi:hypothetical protein